MNKDVIYIEPEDDITDIITKIENSKEKILALVPPKKAGVFRSIVNIKLIAKAGVNAGKTIVLVTTDQSIIKLAAATRLPVTKDLQSAPAIPKVDESIKAETTSVDEVLAADGGQTEESVAEDLESEKEAKPEKVVVKDSKESEDATKADKDDKNDKDDKKSDKDKKKSKMSPKKRKIIIGSAIGGGLLFILILVWAFKIAPAATVTVAIRTTTTNFSENATFTTKMSEENASQGKFYLEEKKVETKVEASFEATGSKNVGEKAKGELIVYQYFKERGNIAIEKGASFTNSELTFVADDDTTLSWDGKDFDKCLNKNDQSSLFYYGCRVFAKIAVTAAEPGTQYNLAPVETGWSTTANVYVYNESAMAGGTTKSITVVTQADIDEALAKIVEGNATAQASRKTKLLSTIEDGTFIIDSSYKQTTSDPKSTPAVGEEVKPNEKATLAVTITDSVYTVDKTKVEEFIAEKAKLAENYKIYEMNDPFIENFTEVDDIYVGKIKTSYVSGPKVTENDVIETIRGKGLGEARADLLNKFSGIDSNKTKIEVSHPWVFSVPSEATKITVRIEVEE